MTGVIIGLIAGVGVLLILHACTRDTSAQALSRRPSARRRVRPRSARQRRALRLAWPDAIDTLASGVRAGLSLPEAVAAVGASGPAQLRPMFAAAAAEHRASGSFREAVARLRVEAADPVADRVGAALLLTAEVGGSDLGVVLRSLSQMLREEARLRAEVEARQSWTVAAARMAVAAPFVTALLLATRPGVAGAYASGAGPFVLASAALLGAAAYLLMQRLARLPGEEGAG